MQSFSTFQIRKKSFTVLTVRLFCCDSLLSTPRTILYFYCAAYVYSVSKLIIYYNSVILIHDSFHIYYHHLHRTNIYHGTSKVNDNMLPELKETKQSKDFTLHALCNWLSGMGQPTRGILQLGE